MGGERLGLRDDLVDAHHDRRAADRRAAAAVGVASVRRDVRVAVQHDDVFDRDADAIGDDLRERRLLPLPVRRDAGDHRHLAGDLHAHRSPFPAAGGHCLRRPHRADLDVGRDADARQLARRASGVAILHELIPVRELLRLRQRALIVAAVVGEAARGRERELRRLRKVLQPDLEAIDAELVRDDVHQPLDQVRRLGAPRAAVRVGRHLVRVDADDLHLHRGNPVAPREHEARERGNGRRQQLQVRSEIGDRARADAEDRAVVADRELVLADLIASVDRRGRVVAARLDPLHRTPQPHRQVRDERFLGVHVQLRAEAAAHLGRDDPQFVLGDANHRRQQRPQQMWNLRRRPDRERALARLERRDDAARLDRHRREALMDQPMPDHAVGAAKRLVDAAAAGDRVRVGDVRAEIRMRERRSRLHRRLGVRDDRQRIVVDVDRLDRVARDVRIGGDRDGNGMADVVHAIAGEHGVLRRLQIRYRRRARDQAAGVVDVGAREDGDDARERARRRDVDLADAACTIPGSRTSST